MTGLYLHVPFCSKKCHYCDFVITTARSGKDQDKFVSAIRAEADYYAKRLGEREFETLYIGGGTPSVLSADSAKHLLSVLRGAFKWKPSAEATLEVNPNDVSPVTAHLWRDLGFGRISIGAQSFNDATLAGVNREHTGQEIERAIGTLRRAGFKNISLDLILSLPGEALRDVENSLECAVRLEPEHISLYELTIEEKTVFGALSKRGRLALPSEEVQLEMLGSARAFLKSRGYRHYELLSYAKPGFESRHNLLYWANEEYLGLGPGAFSYINGRRFRHSASVEEYFDKIKAGHFDPFEEETLPPEKKEIESLLLALRLTDGVSVEKFSGAVSRLSDPIRVLEDKGLLDRADGRLRLTARGQLFAETAFSELSAP